MKETVNKNATENNSKTIVRGYCYTGLGNFTNCYQPPFVTIYRDIISKTIWKSVVHLSSRLLS